MEMEPATFRLVGQRFKQLHQGVPRVWYVASCYYVIVIKWTKTLNIMTVAYAFLSFFPNHVKYRSPSAGRPFESNKY